MSSSSKAAAVRRAVLAERTRCLSIVEQACFDDDVQDCATAICYIRQGILEDPYPDVYEQPSIRIVVKAFRAAVSMVKKGTAR